MLQRRVWVETSKGVLYPNLYTIIIGPPATGKSLCISYARDLLEELDGIHIAPSSVSTASLVDKLQEAKVESVRFSLTPEHTSYHSLFVLASELQVFLPEYAGNMMGFLTDIYDNQPYGEARRTKTINIRIEEPQLNIIAATTPAHLCKFMPEGAWDQGFASRIIMIYDGEKRVDDIFDDSETSGATRQREDLIHDLKAIQGLMGRYTLDPGARAEFKAWRDSGEDPVPNHPKLVYYCSRRTAHTLKLCTVAAASRGDDPVITATDFETARSWLIEAELAMGDVFKAGAAGADQAVLDELNHFMAAAWAKTKKPMVETEIVRFLARRVPNHSVMRTVEVGERAGLYTKKADLRTNMNLYLWHGAKPGP